MSLSSWVCVQIMACYRAMTQLVILSQQEPSRPEKISCGRRNKMSWFSKYLLSALSVRRKNLFSQLILHFNHLQYWHSVLRGQKWGIIKVYLEWRSIKMIAGNLAASRCCGQSNWPEIIEVWYSEGSHSLLDKKRCPSVTDCRPVSVYYVH